MTNIRRTGLVAFAVSLASLAACGGSSSTTAGSGGTGGETAGTGGLSGGSGGSTQDADLDGASDQGGGGAPGTGGAGGMAPGGTGGSNATAYNIKAAEGGTVTAEGLTVKIPAGALAADTDITVAISDGAGLPGAANLAGKVFDLGPSGTMFARPVTLTFDFDTTKVVAPKVAMVAFLQAGAWVTLADSFITGGKASATTTHFTPYGVVITDPVINNCIGMAKAACKTCCDTTFASGKDRLIPAILQVCGCTAGGPCNSQCASNACMGIAISTDCQACMSAEGSKTNSACFDQGVLNCQAMPACNAYTQCSLSCQ
ncbi:MAG TPA: hypothetical protein VNO55_16145 [Polyangia bacterium]|nr:hypothetical protein [Polyangia bacterium]